MTTADSDTELVQLQQHVPFTMVENAIIQSLGDYVALGLYLDMRSRPPGWRINLANLSRSKKQGRDSLTGAMNLLIENGLVFRVKFQRPTGRWATRIYVAQRPVTIDELLAIRDSYSGRCSIVTSAALHHQANPSPTARAAKRAAAPGMPTRADHAVDPASGINQEPRMSDHHNNEHEKDEGNDLVTPTNGKPTVGEPNTGQPDVGALDIGEPEAGQPGAGTPTLKYQEERTNNPPPTPSAYDRRSSRSSAAEEEDHPKHGLTTTTPATNPAAYPAAALDDHDLGVGRSLDRGSHAGGGAALELQQPVPVGGRDVVIDGQVDDVLEQVVAAWPQLGGRDLGKLADPVRAALADGLSAIELSEHLTRNTGGVRHPGSVLLARCNNLPRPRRQPRPLPDWCGQCYGPAHRWVEIGPENRPVRCARCNPQATLP